MFTAKSTQFIFTLVLICVFGAHSFAADLIVEENAVAPNYASIQAAVDDANPGDRIFIKNKSLAIPYLETVTIDKPIGLFPLDPADPWLLTGGILIAPDPANFVSIDEVTIQGAHIISGSISSTTASNALSAIARVNIVSNELDAGSIDIHDQKLKTHASGNRLNNGSLTIGYGIMSANQVNGNIRVSDINQGTTDTTWVVGNRQINPAGGGYPGTVTFDNDDNYMYIANNHFRYNGASSRVVYFSNHRDGGPGGHTIVNNTIESGSSYTDGIHFSASITAGTQVTISNNALYDLSAGEFGSGGEFAIDFPSSISNAAVVLVTNNVYQNYDGGFADISLATLGLYADGNVESVSGTFNPDDVTGECTDADCIDKGSPDNRYTDLDLSRNDVGVSGGSFNYNNFWPILTGGARVYMVKTPRAVIEGLTIDAEVDGYDR
jgi:hypothetical protein